MVIKSHFVNVVVSEEVVPSVWVINEGVVEHEVGLRCISLHKESHTSVEVLQDGNV
jgi:hypothetical protein